MTTYNGVSSGGSGRWLIIAVLLVVASVLLAPKIINIPGISNKDIASVPTLTDTDWDHVMVTGSSVMRMSFTDHIDGTPIPTDGFPSLNGSSGCKFIEDIMGMPCRWEADTYNTDSGDPVIRVRLTVGEDVIAEADSVRASMDEVTPLRTMTVDGHNSGWVHMISVASWVQKSGIGKLILTALEGAIVREHGESLMIFIDAAGWGSRVLADVANKLQLESIFLYIRK